jgi:hypothetical protein
MAYLSSENAILSIAFVLITVVVLRYNRHSHRTKLMGPSTKNLLFGFSKEILNMPDYSHLFEDWERQYGSVYHIPTLFGLKNIVLCDPKAITHHYAGDTFTYRQAPSTRFFFETFVSYHWFLDCVYINYIDMKSLVVIYYGRRRRLTRGFFGFLFFSSQELTLRMIVDNGRLCLPHLVTPQYATSPPFSMTPPIR